MKIKVKNIIYGCNPVRTGGSKSDCFDLSLGEDVHMKKGDLYSARLGVAMQLPKGTYARVYSRSSSPTKLGVGISNSVAIIDNSYNGDKDEWRVQLYAFRNTTIPKGTRICQFEVGLSQFATIWQKLKWLFSSKIVLKSVNVLGNKNRGGIGSTGYI